MIYITSPPGDAYFSVSDLTKHNIKRSADPFQAVIQHQTLVSTLEQYGCRVISVPEFPDHPNFVFTKDTSVCTQDGYIYLRMGLPSRKGEERLMAGFLDRQGIQCLGSITEPGTVEGGDVILAENIAFVGQSSRTNPEGVRQISLILRACGLEVRTALVPAPFLHLGGTMTLVSIDTVITIKGIHPPEFFSGFHQIEVPHTGFISGNVIPMGNNRVIAEKTNEPAIKALEDNGFSVYAMDLSEFVKGTGGPSCLIMEVFLP